eukprot:1264393-Rhodomonas_salina.1
MTLRCKFTTSAARKAADPPPPKKCCASWASRNGSESSTLFCDPNAVMRKLWLVPWERGRVEATAMRSPICHPMATGLCRRRSEVSPTLVGKAKRLQVLSKERPEMSMVGLKPLPFAAAAPNARERSMGCVAPLSLMKIQATAAD